MKIDITTLANTIYYVRSDRPKDCFLEVSPEYDCGWRLRPRHDHAETVAKSSRSYGLIPAHCSREESYAIAQRLISENNEAELIDELLDTAFTCYMQAALWSFSCNCSPNRNSYKMEDIDPVSLQKQRDECSRFVAENRSTLSSLTRSRLVSAMQDFWFSRKGDVSGFWYGAYPQGVGEELAESVKKFGRVRLRVGDDGKLYFSP